MASRARQKYQNKAKNLCTILCLTWTVNANSLKTKQKYALGNHIYPPKVVAKTYRVGQETGPQTHDHNFDKS